MSVRSGTVSGRPEQGEYAAYAAGDFEYVPGEDAIAALEGTAAETVRLFTSVGEEEATGLTYASGKWTLKEVLGHLIDDERIFAYRALCIARGDFRELPGFDENDYMVNAPYEHVELEDLLSEFRLARLSNIAMLRTLDETAWTRIGMANGVPVSVRALAFIMVGHTRHHMGVLRERYGLN